MGDPGLVELLTDRGEPGLRVQSGGVDLRVEQQGFIAVMLDHGGQQAGRQPLAPVGWIGDDAADDQSVALGIRIGEDAQVRREGGVSGSLTWGGVLLGGQEVVLGRRFEVTPVQLLLGAALLAQEDLGAQAGQCVDLDGGQLIPVLHDHGADGGIGTQAEYARIPYADGTLVATPTYPDEDLIPSLLAASDVFGTGWVAADAAECGPGKTVAVVGDGAVGLMGVLAAHQMGAERIIVFSRHADRQALAKEFGATDIIEERGDAGVKALKALTDGLGAHSVIEAVGTQESMMQAVRSTRPGGHIGFVGISHDVEIPGGHLFVGLVHLHGGPAPVRRYLPELIQLVLDRKVDPGKVFTKQLPLEDAAEAYRLMDQREEVKVLLWP